MLQEKAAPYPGPLGAHLSEKIHINKPAYTDLDGLNWTKSLFFGGGMLGNFYLIAL